MHFRLVCLIKTVSAISLNWVSTHDIFKFCTSHVHAFFMHKFFFFGCDVFSLSLSQINCAMTPKVRKSTSTQNPLGSGSSSSSDPIPPLHVWFRDKKARKDFLVNF